MKELFYKILVFLFAPSKKEREKKLEKVLNKIRAILCSDDGFIVFKLQSADYIYDVKWQDIADAFWTGNKLVLSLKSEEEITLPNTYLCWHELVRKLPRGYSSFDYEYSDNFFKNLNGCEVCGLKSMLKNICLSCSSETWNVNLLGQYSSHEEYIKIRQIGKFGNVEENKEIILSNENSDIYLPYEDWVCKVTIEEVKKGLEFD